MYSIDASKKLGSERFLSVVSWESDSDRTSGRVHQLELRIGENCLQRFPEDFDNYTKERVLEIYDSIGRERDFHKIAGTYEP